MYVLEVSFLHLIFVWREETSDQFLFGGRRHPITIVGISYRGRGSDLANQLATKVVELNDEYKAGEILKQWDMTCIIDEIQGDVVNIRVEFE